MLGDLTLQVSLLWYRSLNDCFISFLGDLPKPCNHLLDPAKELLFVLGFG